MTPSLRPLTTRRPCCCRHKHKRRLHFYIAESSLELQARHMLQLHLALAPLEVRRDAVGLWLWLGEDGAPHEPPPARLLDDPDAHGVQLTAHRTSSPTHMALTRLGAGAAGEGRAVPGALRQHQAAAKHERLSQGLCQSHDRHGARVPRIVHSSCLNPCSSRQARTSQRLTASRRCR